MEMNFDIDEQIEQLAKIPKPLRLADRKRGPGGHRGIVLVLLVPAAP